MHKLFTLLFLSLTLFGATPKLYQAVGDPIYKQVPSVKKILDIGYFKEDKKEFSSFIKEASAHKKLGFSYDKKRANKTLSKKEQKAYLNTLRQLEKKLLNINLQAKDAIAVFVKRRYVSSFYQLRDSKLSVLRLDSQTAWLIKKYSYELDKQERLKAQKKAIQAKQRKIAYKKMLRSPKNLNGIWKGKSSDHSSLIATFKANTLSLSYKSDKKIQVLKGEYKVDKNFIFNIKSRKLIISQKQHIRHINIKREYEIKKVTSTELILKYKDEVLKFKR